MKTVLKKLLIAGFISITSLAVVTTGVYMLSRTIPIQEGAAGLKKLLGTFYKCDEKQVGLARPLTVQVFDDSATAKNFKLKGYMPPITWQPFNRKVGQVALEYVDFSPKNLTAILKRYRIGPQFFSLRAESVLYIGKDGLYTFYIENLDDAMRLYIDNKQVFEFWKIAGNKRTFSFSVKLNKGNHAFKIEYVNGPDKFNGQVYIKPKDGQKTLLKTIKGCKMQVIAPEPVVGGKDKIKNITQRREKITDTVIISNIKKYIETKIFKNKKVKSLTVFGVYFNNSCLGVKIPNKVCAQVVTPGFIATVEFADGSKAQVHFNRVLTAYAIAWQKAATKVTTTPKPRVTKPVVTVTESATPTPPSTDEWRYISSDDADESKNFVIKNPADAGPSITPVPNDDGGTNVGTKPGTTSDNPKSASDDFVPSQTPSAHPIQPMLEGYPDNNADEYRPEVEQVQDTYYGVEFQIDDKAQDNNDDVGADTSIWHNLIRPVQRFADWLVGVFFD